MKDDYKILIQRAYPSEEGNSFYMRAGASKDMELVNYKTMAKRTSHLNCESLSRHGMFHSLAAASVEARASWLLKFGKPDTMSKTGMPQLIGFLNHLRARTTWRRALL